MHALSSIKRSPELLRDPGKLIMYCKMHALSSIMQSPEILRERGKSMSYCKIHGLGSIEWSPELLRDPGKLIMYCKVHALSSIKRSPELLRDPGMLVNVYLCFSTILFDIHDTPVHSLSSQDRPCYPAFPRCSTIFLDIPWYMHPKHMALSVRSTAESGGGSGFSF